MSTSEIPEPEEELRPKIQSKMTVATFLAGFTFNALLLILNGHDMPSVDAVFQLLDGTRTDAETIVSLLALIGVLCLTAALALFISAVYMYDVLLMPRRFWTSRNQQEPKVDRLPVGLRGPAKEHGEVYAHMIAVWSRFFTPAVVFAGIGFTMIVLNEDSLLLTAIYAVLVGAVLFRYFKYKPDLSRAPD